MFLTKRKKIVKKIITSLRRKLKVVAEYLDKLRIILLILKMSQSMKPMKVEVYNAVVEDFNKLPSFSRKSENELKKKYKQ